MEIDRGALYIVQTLRRRGYQALLAGGCVRDRVMGRTPADWDIATEAAPDAVMRLFDHTVPVGVRFGVVVVILDDTPYQVARFRRDADYRDGRRPERVELADARGDARRRDFTINGMFYDPVAGELIDYVGGQEDIELGVIRAIGDPAQRFSEDYLRLLRAVRFAARLGFQIEPATRAALEAAVGHIGRISPERIRDELTGVLTEGHAARGFQLLLDTGLLREILPEVAAMHGVQQPAEFHPEGDVWTHVKVMLAKLENPRSTLAWGVLLHDVGKPPTYEEADRIRFNEHDAVGAELAGDICRRLRMSGEEAEQVCQLTAQHMRLRHVQEMRPSKLKRLLRQPFFPELLELHRLDCLASHGLLDNYEFCREQLLVADQEDLRPPRLLSGHDLIEMGFTPGPLFSEILRVVEDGQLEGRTRTRAEALSLVRERFGAALGAR